MISPHLLQRLRDLALVEVETLVAPLEGAAAGELLAVYVADLEDALGQARKALREAHAALGTGPDPLALLDAAPEVRARGGEPAIIDSFTSLGARAAARRQVAQLEEVVRGVLPRLLEADRRLLATAKPQGNKG